jgi:hypothetical protein
MDNTNQTQPQATQMGGQAPMSDQPSATVATSTTPDANMTPGPEPVVSTTPDVAPVAPVTTEQGSTEVPASTPVQAGEDKPVAVPPQQ